MCQSVVIYYFQQSLTSLCLQIYGERDVDGFYRGEAFGRRGLVPGNMVSEVCTINI